MKPPPKPALSPEMQRQMLELAYTHACHEDDYHAGFTKGAEIQREEMLADMREPVEALKFYGDRETWELSGSLGNMREFKALKGWGDPLHDFDIFKERNSFGPKEHGDFLNYKIAGKQARQALQKHFAKYGEEKI